MTMQLKSLHISRPERYDPDYKTGAIRGAIEMEGLHAKVSVKLTDDQCRAKAMTAEVFNLPSSTLIEA